jgi:hypothetical protein
MFCGSAKAEQNIITFGFTGSVLYSDSSLNAPVDSWSRVAFLLT